VNVLQDFALLPHYFHRPAQPALLRAMLVILFLSPIVRWVVCESQWGTVGSFCPTGEPTGSVLLSSITLLFPI
jgi:hypothetical protein